MYLSLKSYFTILFDLDKLFFIIKMREWVLGFIEFNEFVEDY